MYSIRPIIGFDFFAKCILSAANALNMDQSKILSFGKGLNAVHGQYLHCSDDGHVRKQPVAREKCCLTLYSIDTHFDLSTTDIF